MQTSRFQLGLIATLAVGLGFSLASSDAVGYPAATAVSMGTNPVWSRGGSVDSSSVSRINAPADQDMVVTDLLLSTPYHVEWVTLTLEDGTNVGRAVLHGHDSDRNALVFSHQFSSGIRIPAGTYLQIDDTMNHGLEYTLSGYYAQP